MLDQLEAVRCFSNPNAVGVAGGGFDYSWRWQILGTDGDSRGDRDACDQESFDCHFSILV
jgi:hypothetical protein